MSGSFRDLVVWQQSIALTLSIYRLTGAFPSEERFGLVSQMRGAAVSVASNISEGYGRLSRGEYLQFLGNARGSCSELETQLVITRALGYGVAESLAQAEQLCTSVGRLLSRLIASLRT